MQFSKTSFQLAPLALAFVNGTLTLGFYSLVVEKYGVGSLLDCVFAVSLLVNVIFTVTFGQLNEILVPYFVDVDRDGTAAKSLWAIGGAVLLLGGIFSLALFVPVVELAPRLFISVRRESAVAVRQLIVLACIYNTVFSALAVKNCYIVATRHPTLMQAQMALGNALTMGWIWRFGNIGSPQQVIIAQFLGASVALLMPIRGVGRGSYCRGASSRHLVKVWRRVRWLMVNASVSRIEPLFDSVIASFVGPGAVTVFYLFQRVIGFAHTAVQNGYVLPFTAEAAAAKDQGEHFRTVIARGVNESAGLTLGLFISAVAGLWLMRYAPMQAFRSYAAVFRQYGSVCLLLVGYALGCIIVKVYATGLFVIHREKLYTAVSIAGFFCAVALKVAGASYFGLNGLAAGTSIAYAGNAVVLSLIFMRAASHSPRVDVELTPAVLADEHTLH